MITLRKGSKGWRVKQLQKMLGLDLVDGDFGRGTERAVINFQLSHNLVADGLVGLRTWVELNTEFGSRLTQDAEIMIKRKPSFDKNTFELNRAKMLLPLWGYSCRSRVMDAFNNALIYIGDDLKKLHLDTPMYWVAFAATCREETGNNFTLIENLNYRCSVLPKIFYSSYGTMKYGKNLHIKHGRCNGHPADQKAIANHAYANRMGNRGPESNDGWNTRGAGVKQLTGTDNINKYKEWLKKELPDLYFQLSMGSGELHLTADGIQRSIHNVLSAVYFWVDNKLYEGVDKFGLTRKGSDFITKRVNLRTNSYAKRYNHMLKGKKLIGIA